jgi:hypothetical protein
VPLRVSGNIVAHTTETERINERLGKCADCIHAQQIASSKASTFLLCGLSKTDARFPKYPRLPVLSCSGYQKASRPPDIS